MCVEREEKLQSQKIPGKVFWMLFTSVLVSILGKKKKKLTSYNETNLTPSTSFQKTKRESLLLMQLKDKVMVPLQKKP